MKDGKYLERQRRRKKENVGKEAKKENVSKEEVKPNPWVCLTLQRRSVSVLCKDSVRTAL
jgi:hypothetical protein